MKIIERIFSIMNEKNIRSIDLANHLNISKSSVSSWKKRNCNPPLEYSVPISELLDITLEYLITGKENITKSKLTIEEQELISKYRKLSDKNKGKTDQFIDDRLED